MLVIEQLVSPHSHSHVDELVLHTVNTTRAQSDVEFEAGFGDLERDDDVKASSLSPPLTSETGLSTTKAFSLTFGLVIHGLADGLALAASALAPEGSHGTSNLSFIVFLVLIIHKGQSTLQTDLYAHLITLDSSYLIGIDHVTHDNLPSPSKMQEIPGHLQFGNTPWSHGVIYALLPTRTR